MLYAAFGRIPLSGIVIITLLGSPLKCNGDLSPSLLTVMNSDVEAEGMNLDFGVNRFDDKMSVVYQSKFKGLFNLTRLMIKEMSGKMGRDYNDGKTFEDGLTVKVTSKFTIDGDRHYHVYSDGTSSLTIEGDNITFEVVTDDALSYFVIHEKDLSSQ
jgi:hypothetical protein